ncbi:MAG TPA: hypothetical protein VFU80_06060 [Sphingomicrobium sp.]|nr:hypothetical protein [Sphingomicrobium sp.]
MRSLVTVAILILGAACDTQGMRPQDENVVNATVVDRGVVTNEGANFTQGSVTPGEQGNIHAIEPQKPEEIVRQFGDLLEQRRFSDAFRLVNAEAMATTQGQFERRFEQYRTIESAVGTICPTEGAAGSLYSSVQLTLSGNKKDGAAYVMTGPVTLRRVNDVPGSTAEQRRWHIVKMDLTADPKTAASKLEC